MTGMNYTLLLVEDNPGDADLVREALADDAIGIALHHVPRIAAAAEAVAKLEFDAVLLDLSLPDAQGIESFAKMAAIAPDLPIIILTGSTEEDVAFRAVRSGAQDYLHKGELNSTMLTRAIRYGIERKRSEMALLESQERYRLIFESSHEGIVLSSPDGDVLEANPAAARIFGYPLREFKRLNTRTLYFDPSMRERFTAAMTANDRYGYFEARGRHADGSALELELSASVRRYPDGRLLGYQTSIRDVTAHKQAEQRLRTSERRFRTVYDSAPIGIKLIAPDGRYLDVNPAFCQMIGYTRDELLQRTFLDITHPDDVPMGIHHKQQLLTGERDVIHEEKRYICASGEYVWALVSVAVVRGEGGAASYMISQVIDITDRRVTEEKLRDSEERFRALAENSHDLILILDADARVRYVSPSVKRVMGYDPGTIEGRRIFEYMHEDDVPLLQSAFESRSSVPGVGELVTFRARHADGSWRMMEEVGTNLFDHPTIRGLVINARDVTSRWETERALAQAKQELDAVINVSPLPIIVVNESRRVQLWNPAAEQTFGWSAAEVLGQAYPISAPSTTDGEVEHFFRESFRGESAAGTEIWRRRKDGELRLLQLWNAQLPAGPDGKTALVGVMADITESRKMEEQLRQAQKMEAVGRLAGGIAHDFNNMLTAIGGHVHLIQEDLSVSDPIQRDLEEVSAAVDRAANLTRQLLAFSRKQVLQPQPVDVDAVVRGIENMLQRLIGEDVELSTALQSGLRAVLVDRGQLEQVLVNLAVNARDAMPRGGTLSISTEEVDATDARVASRLGLIEGRYISIVVTDNGHGMDAATTARIFEPFFTTKAVGHGTGLGLSTVYGIVKQSGGEIHVRSAPGAGTTFTISFPVVDGPVVECVAIAEKVAAQTASGTILLVEDEAPVRGLVEKVLIKRGYVVVATDSPAAAREQAKKFGSGIDLLLSDVVMPGGTGRDLADELCAMLPGLRVLFMSGYAEDAIHSYGHLNAGSAFISKPFSPDELVQSIQRVLASA